MRTSPKDRFRKISPGYSIAIIAALVLCATILVGTKTGVVSLLASSASSLNEQPAVIFFAPHEEEELTVGATTNIDVRVNTRVPINAVGATISIPPDTLEILGISKRDSFLDLWSEETTIREESGEVHFSGGTLMKDGLTGIGTLITFTLRAKKPGRAELSFKEADIFAHDGKGKALESEKRSFAYVILETTSPLKTTVSTITPTRPSPDLNNDGRFSLADVSILAIQLLAPYNARYDLNIDGTLGLADISIMFVKMREN